jgi:hypothetical protein
MTKVPIQFEPTSDSPLPVLYNCPKFEMTVVLGRVERYICLSAAPARSMLNHGEVPLLGVGNMLLLGCRTLVAAFADISWPLRRPPSSSD